MYSSLSNSKKSGFPLNLDAFICLLNIIACNLSPDHGCYTLSPSAGEHVGGAPFSVSMLDESMVLSLVTGSKLANMSGDFPSRGKQAS